MTGTTDPYGRGRQRRNLKRRQRARAKAICAIDFETRCPMPFGDAIAFRIGNQQNFCSGTTKGLLNDDVGSLIDSDEARLYTRSTTQERPMTIISTHEKALISAGAARAQSITMLHRSGIADAERLQRLVGQRCRCDDKLYEIASVKYGYGGFITAKAYPIENGVRAKKAWDIGPLSADMFNGL